MQRRVLVEFVEFVEFVVMDEFAILRFVMLGRFEILAASARFVRNTSKNVYTMQK